MQTLQVLVRNLAVVLLLATVLDLLLPSGKMNKYVQLMMGLFVIAAVLTPVTTFLHLPLSMEIPAWNTVQAQDLPVLADSQGKKAGQDAVLEQFRRIITNQVRALAIGLSGAADAEVEVGLGDNPMTLTEQPQIKAINVRLIKSPGVEPVKPAVIGTEPAPIPLPGNDEVREKLAAMLGVPKEVVTVTN